MKFFRKIILVLLILNFEVKAAELKTISAEKYLAENPSTERQAILNFITHQFDSKKEQGVTQEEIDKLWGNIEARKAFYMARFQIINQKLYVDSYDPTHRSYWENIAQYLKNLLQKYEINDVDFIIYARDEIPQIPHLMEYLKSAPGFIMSKDSNDMAEKDLLLLPNISLIVDSWPDLVDKILKARIEFPWDTKINQIFWRGFLTGGSDDIDSLNLSKRLKLVMLSKLYPNLIDAKLTGYWNIVLDSKGPKKLSIAYFLYNPSITYTNTEPQVYGQDNQVPAEEHLKYKYLISLDGNTCAWSRPVWIMLSNSVLVKQETSKMEWFYPALKPYVHYVPVNDDITDIFEKIEWMKNHDGELQKISQNAQNFVSSNLMPEDIEKQYVLILNEYHKLFKGEKIVATLPEAEETIAKAAPKEEHKIKRVFNSIKEKIMNLFNTVK